ncbi:MULTISPECIES: hypothetical protein [Bradyrhizobium]|uniref:Uncharacterized protein n=1 Tax=Bradyrhizobium elkanii TaxID=29448 RepID=A0A4U6S197_BRAEL|nr:MULTISPECIES: hypothetical protein [Bradyrhizobium]MTV15906.1 hypothetical protein [Bradyrhizobium sp. BR2003]TKV80880.1 hypothetical protein FDV58_15925 [Bradyrhizobium elkanii]
MARDERRAGLDCAPFLVVRRSEEGTGSIEVSLRHDSGVAGAAAWRGRVNGIYLPSLRGDRDKIARQFCAEATKQSVLPHVR